jgi:hypothetical protein
MFKLGGDQPFFFFPEMVKLRGDPPCDFLNWSNRVATYLMNLEIG